MHNIALATQSGKISTGWLAAIVSISVIALIIVTVAVSYIGAYNYGARAENDIKAQYENMENILAQYSLKVSEAAQVPGMYKDDMKEVMTSVMTARMGEDGSKAMFQWFQEHNVNLDASVYKQIQQIIEAGRDKFENAQTKFIDTKRGYQTQLDYFWSGMWLRIAGYPKIDLSKYEIISSGHAREAFDTKVDKGLQLR